MKFYRRKYGFGLFLVHKLWDFWVPGTPPPLFSKTLHSPTHALVPVTYTATPPATPAPTPAHDPQDCNLLRWIFVAFTKCHEYVAKRMIGIEPFAILIEKLAERYKDQLVKLTAGYPKGAETVALKIINMIMEKDRPSLRPVQQQIVRVRGGGGRGREGLPRPALKGVVGGRG